MVERSPVSQLWEEKPFGHAVIDGFGNFDGLLDDIVESFPAADHPGWQRFQNGNEVKLGGTELMLTEPARQYLGLIKTNLDWFTMLTGIENLSMEITGGGFHLIPSGGKLDMHVDFTRSPKTGLYRRLNVLTYLNHDWTDEGGHLYLGANMEIDIAPEFGRTAIFATSDDSWHGHPIPAQRERRSIAAYLYSPEPPPGFKEDHSTIWLGQ